METQSRYIAELRNEIYSSKTQCVNGTLMTQKHLARCEENCKKAADQSFTKFEGQMINRWERDLICHNSASNLKLFQRKTSPTRINGRRHAIVPAKFANSFGNNWYGRERHADSSVQQQAIHRRNQSIAIDRHTKVSRIDVQEITGGHFDSGLRENHTRNVPGDGQGVYGGNQRMWGIRWKSENLAK